MALSHELVSQFAKLVNSKEKKSSAATTVYGTVVVEGDNKYVRVDGSDQLIPIEDGSTVVDANVGERVSVSIGDHTATVTGNVSSPAARTGDVKDVTDRVTEIEKFDLVLAERVEAQEGYIEDLQADMAEFGDLKAATAKIEQLEANDVKITGQLEASNAEITNLKTIKLDAEVANAKFATIDKLNANTAKIDQLDADKASVHDLEAVEADITKLNAEKASVEDLKAANAKIENLDSTFATIENLNAAEAKIEDLEAEDAKINGTLVAHNAVIADLNASYASIDFANIEMAAVEKLFATSGIIKDLVVGDTSITGELVGVTIKGDLIEAGTLKADKLVVKGSDGIFYKLNVEAGGISAEEAPDDGLHGSVIVAKSITAEKVNVHDLVAFGATIGHFHIEENSEETLTRICSLPENGGDCNFASGAGDYTIASVAEDISSDWGMVYFTDGSYCECWWGSAELYDYVPSIGDVIRYDEYHEQIYLVEGTSARSGSIYSGVKADVNNTTEGIYMDSTGQFNVGNGSNFLKFFKDQNGEWKLNISADSITFGTGKKSVEEAIDEVAESTKGNTEDLTKYIAETTKELENLQGQIDGSITTWFFEYEPTNDNAPASEWTTTDLKNNHLGDLFYDTLTGYCYRWQVQNNNYKWDRITDVDVTKALSDAAKAQSTADGKRRVFVDTPKPPYDIGDLWAQGASGELMRCQTAKTESQSYAAADWVKASKYTDDTAANAAQADANALKTRVTNAETQISQNKEAITLRATKEEVTQNLGNYYTKTESDAKLEISAESVKTEVSKTYATKQEVDDIQIGGRNLLLNSSFKENIDEWQTTGDVLDEQHTIDGEQVLRADDVSDKYPATVQLTSKNLLDLKEFEPSQGSIIERLENGVIYQGKLASSVPQSWANGWLYMNYSKGHVPLQAGTTVTVSVDYTLLELAEGRTEDQKVGVYLYGPSTYTALSDITPKLGEKRRIYCTYTVRDDGDYYPEVTSNSNKVKIENPQIELGSTATSYYQHTAPSGHSVTVCGKNLFNQDLWTQHGFVKQTDGSYIHSYSENGALTINERVPCVLPEGVYTISAYVKSEPGHNYRPRIVYADDTHQDVYKDSTGEYVFFTFKTNGKAVKELYFHYSSQLDTDVQFKEIQIEKSSIFTEYEPYKESATCTADENGLVTIDTPYSPSMTVTSGTDGIILDMTYNLNTGFLEKNGKQCLNIKHVTFEKTKCVYQNILSRIERGSKYMFSGWFLIENLVEGTTEHFRKLYIDGYYTDSEGARTWYALDNFWLPNDTAGQWQYVTGEVDASNLPEEALDCMLYIHTRDMTGDIYFYDLKLEKGNRATDWTPAPEDSSAELNDLASEISRVEAYIETKGDQIVAQVATDYATKGELGALQSATTTLELTSEGLKTSVETVESAMNDGFEELKIKGKNFTMNQNGFTVEDINPDTGNALKTTISNNGMTVYKNETDKVLTANDEGVVAVDLHAKTYLIIGENSRFEDYRGNRTACFWLGKG